MTAAYMRILIHTMNNSLFPDADPGSTTWTGPPPEIVTVQSLLYASLTTSLFAAFLAMLGKQWVNRYLRSRGGSAADKSRDRQRKLDGFEEWHFHLAIESLPVMLQLALLLLGCALSKYLWTISRTVAGVVVAVTIFGVTSYVFLTLAATIYYNCPYQTPPSILIRTTVKFLTQDDAKFPRALRSIAAPLLPIIIGLRQTPRRLRTGVRGMLHGLSCIPGVPGETEHIPLAIITSSPDRIFEDVFVDWEVLKADVRCISWVLSSTTDTDVIYSTVRCAADMPWYPEIAEALSPHILAELFFDCLLDGKLVPGKLEHASSIGMALASVLSTQLTIKHEDQALVELCESIRDRVDWNPSPEPTFKLVINTLISVAAPPAPLSHFDSVDFYLFWDIPNGLPATHKLWLSRIVLQTVWRWRCVQEPTTVLCLDTMRVIFGCSIAGNDQIFAIFKTNCFLTMAICLGLRISIHDLYATSYRYVAPTLFSFRPLIGT